MPPKRKSETSAGVRTLALGEEIFTTDQIAHDLNVSVHTVLRAISSGKLKARKMGKQFLITRTEIREFYEGLPMADEVPKRPRKPREPKATPSAQEPEPPTKSNPPRARRKEK